MTHAHAKPYDNVLETIGWTPLIRLNRVAQGIRTPVYAKAEMFNPGGSVKDRIGLAMIEAAEREGRLKPGGLIVEATSGNTGVGLALAAAVKGYRCIFTMPDKMSQEKARLLRALGAEVIITPTAVAPDHPDNYIMKGRAIAAAHSNAIFADQHYNQVNPEAHYRTTGPEIWEQTAGKITHFVCSPGTGGTVTGAGRFLKEKNAVVRVVAGDPVGSIYTEYARTHKKADGAPYKVEGIGGDKIPSALDFAVVDEWLFVSDKDAFLMARRLAKEEGLFCGGSTGVNVVTALDVARKVNDPKAMVVTILCGFTLSDGAHHNDRYSPSGYAMRPPSVARPDTPLSARKAEGEGVHIRRVVVSPPRRRQRLVLEPERGADVVVAAPRVTVNERPTARAEPYGERSAPVIVGTINPPDNPARTRTMRLKPVDLCDGRESSPNLIANDARDLLSIRRAPDLWVGLGLSLSHARR